MEYSEKYLNKRVRIIIDRLMGSKHPTCGFIYPVNYGFVPDTIAPDGDEIDAYLLGVFEPVSEFTGTCIAVIERSDDDDDKLIIVPEGRDYSDDEILALTEFQEQFFKSTVKR